MNREIKFRAWQPTSQVMLYNYQSGELNDVTHNSIGVHDGLPYMICSSCDGRSWVEELEEGAVMQSTGLKDKNGVEIYEGDIVHERYYPLGAYHDVMEYYKVGVVVWPKGVMWKIDGTKVLDENRKQSHNRTEREIYKHPTAGVDWIEESVWFHKTEVIGNIYEHPHLLNVEAAK